MAQDLVTHCRLIRAYLRLLLLCDQARADSIVEEFLNDLSKHATVPATLAEMLAALHAWLPPAEARAASGDDPTIVPSLRARLAGLSFRDRAALLLSFLPGFRADTIEGVLRSEGLGES